MQLLKGRQNSKVRKSVYVDSRLLIVTESLIDDRWIVSEDGGYVVDSVGVKWPIDKLRLVVSRDRAPAFVVGIESFALQSMEELSLDLRNVLMSDVTVAREPFWWSYVRLGLAGAGVLIMLILMVSILVLNTSLAGVNERLDVMQGRIEKIQVVQPSVPIQELRP